MTQRSAAAPAPQAPLNYFEVSCAGQAVAEQPSQSLSMSIERTGFRFALGAPKRFWVFLTVSIASAHPLTLKLLQWAQQLLAHFH